MRRLGIVVFLTVIAGAIASAGPGEVTVQNVPLSQLVSHLRGADADARLAALLVLDGVGAEAAAAVPALTELLDSNDGVVRALSASVLSGMGSAASPAAAKLKQLAENDPDNTVRGYAQMALMEVGAPVWADEGAGVGADELYIEPVPQVPEPQLPAADPGVTAYLQPLRNHKAALAAIKARIDALAAHQPADNAQARTWAQDLQKAGQDLLAEGRSFRSTLNQFINSRTRRGLTEELDLIEDSMELTDNAGTALRSRTGFDLQAWAADRDLQQQAAAARQELIGMLAGEIDDRLEAEGMLVLLATQGISAVNNEAISRLRTGAEQELDRITQQELGIAFHDAGSFRSAVRQRARDLVRRKVHQLLFKVTSNAIVVELLGAPIISWLENDLWPKLKEAFRNKGNLEFRTQRSAASLERARMRLWSLPPDAKLDQVRAALRGAEGAKQATRYLVGDLNRANRADLYAQLETAAAELNRAISITQQRFLLHKLEALEKVEPEADVYRALLTLIEAMVRDIEIPEAVAETDDGGDDDGQDQPERPEEITFGPLYLVHLIETSTMNGPVEKDVWILYPNKPDENGILLTADGYGGNFINKTDNFMGPYTSSYELAPVLVGLGIRGISYGRLYINADPAIWGGG